jgi:uncharacterized protein
MTMASFRMIAAFVSGLIFSIGLALSGMLDPARVRGFLDLAGAWQPGLAFVLAGAVAIAFLGQVLAHRMARPLLDQHFHEPAIRTIDRRLLLGSAIFGIGWGMAGFCPGPALAALSLGLTPVFIFVIAMLAGMAVYDRGVARMSGVAAKKWAEE